MTKRKKSPSRHKKPLDSVSGERGRGRPWRVRPSEIIGRADNYRGILTDVWDRLWPLLSQAQTEQDVIKAFEDSASAHPQEFVSLLVSLILKVIRDPRFPKKREAQINFLADSLAGLGRVTPRRSRDICASERAKERAKSPHQIIRYEFYVECSCGYKGPARDSACRKCGAEIPPSLGGLVGPELS